MFAIGVNVIFLLAWMPSCYPTSNARALKEHSHYYTARQNNTFYVFASQRRQAAFYSDNIWHANTC